MADEVELSLTFLKLVYQLPHLEVTTEGGILFESMRHNSDVEFVYENGAASAHYLLTEVWMDAILEFLLKMARKALHSADWELIIYSNPSREYYVARSDPHWKRVGVIPLHGDEAFTYLSDAEKRWAARKDWISVIASSMNKGGRRSRSKKRRSYKK